LFSLKSKTNQNNSNTPAHQQQNSRNGQPAPTGLQQIVGNQALANRMGAGVEQQIISPYLSEADAALIYQDALYMPLKDAVTDKLGLGRGAWRRSDELNQFRQKLKDAARKQANEDIVNDLKNHDSLKNKSQIGKSFYEAAAKKEAYSTSKSSVDETVKQEADKIVKDIIPAKDTQNKLKEAANKVSGPLSLSNVKEDKIVKAARTGAVDKAKELLKLSEPKAVDQARKLVKGDQKNAQDPAAKAALATSHDQIAGKVQDQVKSDGIGNKAITHVINSESLNSGLTKIAGVIDRVVPRVGDAASMEFELRIPLGDTGAYALIHLGAEAERDEQLTVGAQIGVGVGFDAAFVDVNFQVGMFVEAEASNSKSAMNLLSYGMFRHMSSSLPTVAESLWGMGGKALDSKMKEAELWASAIEAEEMEKGGSVDVGKYYQGAIALELGIVEADISLGRKKLTHYDKASVMKASANQFGNSTNTNQLLQKNQQLTKMAPQKVYEASGEVALDLGFGELGLNAEGSATFKEGKMTGIEISVGAALPFDYGEESADWVMYISKMAKPALSLVTTVRRVLENKNKNHTPGTGQGTAPQGTTQKQPEKSNRNQGTAGDVASDLMILMPQFDSLGQKITSIGSEIDLDTGEVENMIALKSSTTLTFSFEKEWDLTGSPKEWKLSLELGSSKSFEIDAEIAKFSVEKTKRLARFVKEG